MLRVYANLHEFGVKAKVVKLTSVVAGPGARCFALPPVLLGGGISSGAETLVSDTVQPMGWVAL